MAAKLGISTAAIFSHLQPSCPSTGVNTRGISKASVANLKVAVPRAPALLRSHPSNQSKKSQKSADHASEAMLTPPIEITLLQ